MRSRRTVIALVVTAGILGLIPVAPNAAFAADPCTQVDKFIAEQERIAIQQDTLTEDAVTAQDDLRTVEEEIAKSQVRIGDLQNELSVLQSALGDLALQAFVSGDQVGGLGTLLINSGSINDAVEREQYAALALNTGQVSTDDLDAKVNDLNKEQKQLERKQKQAEDYKQLIADKLAKAQEYEKQLQEGEQRAKVKCDALIVARRKAIAAQQLAEAQAIAKKNAQRPRATGGGGGGGTSNTGGNAGGGTAGGTAGGGSSGGGSSSGGGGGNRNPPRVSAGASGAVEAALGQQGTPYRFATAEPGVAFDCSGLTSWAWAQAGVSLPHQSRAQYASTQHVDPADAQPGDLIFFHNPISHVAMYIGGGQMVHAVNSGTVVSISSVNWGKVVGVGRPG